MTFSRSVHCAEGFRLSFLTVLASVANTANSNTFFDTTELSAVINTEWAITNNNKTENNETQKLELSIEPELDININDNTQAFILGRLRSDKKKNIDPDDNNQAELRELYLDFTVNNTSIILGKQQIVWGKSDGLKVLDVVNPQDFREFILDDFDQSRIPLWSINTETDISDITLQFIIIADQTYHELAENNATYAFTSPLIIPPTPPGSLLIVNPTLVPDKSIEDSDVGIRLTSFWHGWDLTINYLYHYNDTPVLFRTLNLTPGGLEVIISPRHTRNHLLGGTFSNSFGDLTLRGEVGYSTDRFISTTDATDNDGVIKSNELSYVLGFDWFGLTDTFISLQLFQTYLDNHKTEMIVEEVTSIATFLVRNDYLNETLNTEVLWLHDIDIDDGLVRPKISYDINDELRASAGLDIFYGKKTGTFGQFKDTDRLMFNLTYGIQ